MFWINQSKMKKLIAKYVKQMQRFNQTMSPSDVHFVHEDTLELDKQLELDLQSQFEHLDLAQLPKLQVSQKNGQWFALNSTLLSLLRSLQAQGRCDKITVEVIALSKVPTHVQAAMVSELDTERLCSSRTSPSSSCTSSMCSISSCNSSCCSACANNTITTTISNCHLRSSQTETDVDTLDNKTCLISDCPAPSTSSSCYSDCSGCAQTFIDDSLMCIACNKNFSTSQLLVKHQLKKKHFACPCCKKLFSNIMKLEYHKHQFQHWSLDDHCSMTV